MDRRSVLKNTGAFAAGIVLGGVPAYRLGQGSGYHEAKMDYWKGELVETQNTDLEEEERDPTTDDERVVDISRDVTIDAGDHYQEAADFDQPTLLSYIFDAEDHIDALVLDREQYREYQDGGDPTFLVLASREDTTTGYVHHLLPDGSYNFVIDNTAEFGRDDPAGQAEVEFVFRAYQTPED